MKRIDDTTWAFVAKALEQMARIDHQNEHIIDTLDNLRWLIELDCTENP